mmetsp:Transcript_58047/g.124721  ORF Transcript_58047/g.124721 Transcript_58047/m.124721 type:complete len:134 (-) Transcript_58047:226-627(-)
MIRPEQLSKKPRKRRHSGGNGRTMMVEGTGTMVAGMNVVVAEGVFETGMMTGRSEVDRVVAKVVAAKEEAMAAAMLTGKSEVDGVVVAVGVATGPAVATGRASIVVRRATLAATVQSQGKRRAGAKAGGIVAR